MTLVHIVLVAFKTEVTDEQKEQFKVDLRVAAKTLPSVIDGRLIAGGPSVAQPYAMSSTSFDLATVSYHTSKEDLNEYYASKEYDQITSQYIYPLAKDVIRFDFEVDPQDEHLLALAPK